MYVEVVGSLTSSVRKDHRHVERRKHEVVAHPFRSGLLTREAFICNHTCTSPNEHSLFAAWVSQEVAMANKLVPFRTNTPCLPRGFRRRSRWQMLHRKANAVKNSASQVKASPDG